MSTESNHRRRPYPEEFRREAVALYRRGGASLKEVAADLGVSVESLRIWVKQDAVDQRKESGLTTDERWSCGSCGGRCAGWSRSGRS